MSSNYIPGVCNIGPKERAMRRLGGIIGAAAAVVTFGVLIATGAPRAERIVLFLPASFAAVNFLQDRLHFCAAFGLQGLYNVLNTMGPTANVDSDEFRRQDRRKALNIIGMATAIGIVITLLALAYPAK